MAQVNCIVFTNNKGGTSKTETACNWSAYYALLGHFVVAVDMDSQASLTSHFDIDKAQPGLAEVLRGEKGIREVLVQVASVPNLLLLPAGQRLAEATEGWKLNDVKQKQKFKKMIQDLVADYKGEEVPLEMVVLDVPPSLNAIAWTALYCATHIAIPVISEEASIDGLDNLLRDISQRKEILGATFKLVGVFVTQFRDLESQRQVVRKLAKQLNGLFFPEYINQNEPVALSYAKGKPVIVSDPESEGARRYLKFCKSFLTRLRGEK